jgi:hypothetical protein
MSKFALVAQAAGLLGQVLKYVSSHTADQALHHEEGLQLDRTLHALIKAAEAVKSPDCDQMAICYRYIFRANFEALQLIGYHSALLALHEPHLSSDSEFSVGSDQHRYARTVTETVSKLVATESSQQLLKIALNPEIISPWGLQLVYQASVTCIRLNRETNTLNSAEALKILQQTLRALDVRWKAAGTCVLKVCS